jgi:hypothetical protein
MSGKEFDDELSQVWADFTAFARRYHQETEAEGKEILILTWLRLADTRLRKLEEKLQGQ